MYKKKIIGIALIAAMVSSMAAVLTLSMQVKSIHISRTTP